MAALIFCKERLHSELCQHQGSQCPDATCNPSKHSAKRTGTEFVRSAVADFQGHTIKGRPTFAG